MEEQRVCAKRSGFPNVEVDRLSNLPDCLLVEILSKLPTKDVIKCSVLSSRWRNLWKHVHVLHLECGDFTLPYYDHCQCDDDIWSAQNLGCYNAFVSFVDKFLGFNSIQEFRLYLNWYGDVQLDVTPFTRWINTLVDLKVKHLRVCDKTLGRDEVEMPSTVYTCESLVSLNLYEVYLPNPDRAFLPCLKVLVLDSIMFEFEDDKAFEMLISGCPVLETLIISLDAGNIIKTFQVSSQSLLRYTHDANNVNRLVEDMAVVIDAPRLEFLRLSDHQTSDFVLEHPGSLVEADTDITFNLGSEQQLSVIDLPKRKMIRDFLVVISCVKDIKISSSTLQGFEPPIMEGVSVSPGPRKLLTSLEYVKIVKPMAEEAAETKLKLVSYFLENSTILKKLTLCLGKIFRRKQESILIKKLLNIPRLSSSCQVCVP